MIELAMTRGPIRASEIFNELVTRGLESPGAVGRNRTNSIIRNLIRLGGVPEGSIFYEDQSLGTSKYDLDPHIIRIATECAPIAPVDITRKLMDEGHFNNIGVKTPEHVTLRRLKHLRTVGLVKEEWLADGRLSEEKERLKVILPDLLRQWQPIGVRGVFYQLVALGEGPKTDRFCDRVNRVLTWLRENDEIPWEWISETGRTIRQNATFDSLREGVDFFADYWYSLNPWRDIDTRVQIWIEKRGLAGVVSDVTDEYNVPLLASGGFSSLTLCNKAAELINEFDGITHCYYFGDHDPSGVKIDPAIESRLAQRSDPSKFIFRRVAITADDIERYQLPTRPAKKDEDDGNPNLPAFLEKHGNEAVELDALPPDTLRQLVRDEITKHIDDAHIERVRAKETKDRTKLKRAIAKLKL